MGTPSELDSIHPAVPVSDVVQDEQSLLCQKKRVTSATLYHWRLVIALIHCRSSGILLFSSFFLILFTICQRSYSWPMSEHSSRKIFCTVRWRSVALTTDVIHLEQSSCRHISSAPLALTNRCSSLQSHALSPAPQ